MPSSDLKIKVGVDSKGVKKGVKESKSSIKSLGRTMQTALGFGLANVIGKIVSGLKTVLVESVKVHARYERLRLTFDKLLGSKNVGGELMSSLRDFSVRTPFEPEDVFKASKLLLSFGLVAKDQMKTLKMLGDVASVSGKPLEELAFIYGKVFSRGRAQAREMNQLIRAQIPITREVAKVMGVAENQIADLTRNGKVGFEDVKKALENLTGEGGQFFNMTLDSSKTLEGRWSTLVGVLKDAGDAFANLFDSETRGGLELLIRAAEAASDSFKGLALKDPAPDFVKHAFGDDLNLSPYERLRIKKQFVGLTEREAKAFERIKQLRKEEMQEMHKKDKAIRNATSAAKLLKEAESKNSKAAKNPFDKFFQQGQFMFDPLNIPKIDVQERQLTELQEIKFLLSNGTPVSARIVESGMSAFNAIKQGAGSE